MLLVWFYMECRDCKRMNWIAWRGKWFDYGTCTCHDPPAKEAAPAPPTKTKPIEGIAIDGLVIPGELVGPLKDYCFKHDTTKKDVLIEALRQYLAIIRGTEV